MWSWKSKRHTALYFIAARAYATLMKEFYVEAERYSLSLACKNLAKIVDQVLMDSECSVD
jgi:hypothetical protein